ncbi:MAG: phosphoribosyltransferase family protein [Synergistaceae bacterium]
MFLKKLYPIIKHLIWPRYCPVCGMISSDCCWDCLESLVANFPIFSLDNNSTYFPDEKGNETPCFAFAEHQGVSREIILKLKYSGLKSVGIKMGRAIALKISPLMADIILPMPLHYSSKREYNQACLIAEGISSVYSIPVRTDILEWSSNATAQTSSTARERKSLPHNSLQIKKDINGMKVILVDDVYTTGTTLRIAKHNIEKAGGKVVFAFVWTRRLRGHS